MTCTTAVGNGIGTIFFLILWQECHNFPLSVNIVQEYQCDWRNISLARIYFYTSELRSGKRGSWCYSSAFISFVSYTTISPINILIHYFCHFPTGRSCIQMLSTYFIYRRFQPLEFSIKRNLRAAICMQS